MCSRCSSFGTVLVAAAIAASPVKAAEAEVSFAVGGELKRWHDMTIDFVGPSADESDATNPFVDYRLDVTFAHEATGESLVVPGYFAADGRAADSGATGGNVWRVHLAPRHVGAWTFAGSFRKGKGVAIADDPLAGEPAAFDGATGRFDVAETDKTGRDLRAKGELDVVGGRYLRFAGTGEYFLKQGPDSPENLLAYEDIDNTSNVRNRLKSYAAHRDDYDPASDAAYTWGDGKGTELLGAINYLASEGLNSISFIPMTFAGDDKNVFPWVSTDPADRLRIDVSKLAHWEKIFSHATAEGFFLHFKTQETENELLLDGGDLGPERRLYYRELIARFGHHLALNWNLGEEINDATTEQKRAWAAYFDEVDPYDHLIVIHSYPNKIWAHADLLGDACALTGFSLQTDKPDFRNVHRRVREVLTRSTKAGRTWAVAVDEPGDAKHALRPDADRGNSHEDARRNALWPALLAGAWGHEWYFGYSHAHSDLTCQDFRSRDAWWDVCRHALAFFGDNDVPFWEMEPDDSLVTAESAYAMADRGEVYVAYLAKGGSARLDLRDAEGAFSVAWYEPREGGPLRAGSVERVTGGGKADLGLPPVDADADWVVLVRRLGSE